MTRHRYYFHRRLPDGRWENVEPNGVDCAHMDDAETYYRTYAQDDPHGTEVVITGPARLFEEPVRVLRIVVPKPSHVVERVGIR